MEMNFTIVTMTGGKVRENIMKRIMLLSLSFIVILLIIASQVYATDVDFSIFSSGDSVEGLGSVHPYLNISSSYGMGGALIADTEPIIFTAPNDSPRPNGGIAVLGGFADFSSVRLHDFVFTFADSLTLTNFSIRMLDYGDFNPGGATNHTVRLEAFNTSNALVDFSELNYTSDSAGNPTTGSFGNLHLTGDSVSASDGEPGKFTFSVSGADINLVRVVYNNNGTINGPSDPNIGFDTLTFTVVPEPISLTLFMVGGATLGFSRYWKRRRQISDSSTL